MDDFKVLLEKIDNVKESTHRIEALLSEHLKQYNNQVKSCMIDKGKNLVYNAIIWVLLTTALGASAYACFK